MIRHMHGCWRGNDKHSRAIAMDRIYFPAKRNTIVALKSCLFTSRKKINIFPLSKLSYAIGGCKVERRAWTFPWWFGTTRIKIEMKRKTLSNHVEKLLPRFCPVREKAKCSKVFALSSSYRHWLEDSPLYGLTALGWHFREIQRRFLLTLPRNSLALAVLCIIRQ